MTSPHDDIDPWEVRGTVIVSRKGAARIGGGHLWIYRSDLERDPGLPAGFVRVEERGGRPVGHAMYSPASQISLRWVSNAETPPTAPLFAERLGAAFERRRTAAPDADAFRWVHGEADLLPGIFIDRYGDAVALQTTCAGADLLEPALVPMMMRHFAARAVVLRDDSGARDREGLRRKVEVVVGSAPVVTRYHEGKVELEVDLLRDQKTGGFLDQSANHVRAGTYARGEALDCFTYHGGFALQLAAAGAKVTAVDLSAPALERARTNAARNQLTGIDWIEGDAFAALDNFRREQRQFDLVVLDPPAFASGKKTVEAATAAYKQINLRGLQLLRPGGILVTCSCSGRMRPDEFDAILAAAASDARRRVHVIEKRAAGPDHPVLLGVDETDYLKCRILRAL